MAEMGGARKPLLAGRRVSILDGNHLAATQKRLRVTRGHTAGPLPGQVLAILHRHLLAADDKIEALGQFRDDLKSHIQRFETWLANHSGDSGDEDHG